MIHPGLIAALLSAEETAWSADAWNGSPNSQDNYLVSCLQLFMARIEDAYERLQRKKMRALRNTLTQKEK